MKDYAAKNKKTKQTQNMGKKENTINKNLNIQTSDTSADVVSRMWDSYTVSVFPPSH